MMILKEKEIDDIKSQIQGIERAYKMISKIFGSPAGNEVIEIRGDKLFYKEAGLANLSLYLDNLKEYFPLNK